MTKEEIAELNAEFLKKYNTYDQGVYVEPYGIPNNIKEPVVYMKWSQVEFKEEVVGIPAIPKNT